MGDPLVASRPAVAAIELASIARGVVVLDQMAKRAETTIVAARTLSPGRYLILFTGEVAEVEEAMDAAQFAADEDKVDDVLLRDPHDGLRNALACELKTQLSESMAIIETGTVCSTLLSVDRCLKEADVQLIELRLGAGLSGKGVFSLTGPLHMIQAAKDTVESLHLGPKLVRIEVIAQPHPDLPERLLTAEQALPRGLFPQD